MDELIFVEFNVTADTGIVIDGEPVYEYRTVMLEIDPCRIVAVVEELKTHYVSIDFEGNVALLYDIYKMKY